MKWIFTHIHKRSGQELSFAAQMTGGVAALLLVAAFIAGNGMYTVNKVLVAYNIVPGNLTGCVFPCNNNAYAMQALIPESSQGVPASSFMAGQTIRFQWIAGSYGANHYAPACFSSPSNAYTCTVALGSPNTNFSGCVPEGTCTGSVTCSGGSCDKNGSCSPTTCSCNGAITSSPSAGCGNANDFYGNACFNSNSSYPIGSQPGCQWGSGGGNGYDGNWNDSGWGTRTSIFTAPATAGTYTYYFCSNALLHGAYNSNISALPCLGTSVNVIDCNTSGFSSPWNSNSYLILAGGKGTVNNWYGRFCIQNLSSNAVYVPMATQTEWNNFKSAASGLSLNVFSY